MADGGLTIELDEALTERLRAAASAAGESLQDYAINALKAAAGDGWDEAVARLAEYRRTGRYLDAEEAMKGFRDKVREGLRVRQV
jgi:predicted transcriptional regulator